MAYIPIQVNPYRIGPFDPRTFKGRKSELGWLKRGVVQSSRQEPLVLHGQSRVGKTWLVRQFLNSLPDDYVGVYLDLLCVTCRNVANLLYGLAERVHAALHQARLSIPEPTRRRFAQDPYKEFLRFSSRIECELGARQLVIVVDEFTRLVENMYAPWRGSDALPETIFEYLGTWIQSMEKTGIILVGHPWMQEQMSTRRDEALLFRIARDCRLSYLEEYAARELITEPVRGWSSVSYESSAIDRMVSVTCGHPYFIQLLCNDLVELAREEKRNCLDLADVDGMILKLISYHEAILQRYYQPVSQSAQRVLTVLGATTDDLHPSLAVSELSNLLPKYGLGSAIGGLSEVLRELVRYDLVEEIPHDQEHRYAIKLPLLRLQLKQSGRLKLVRDISKQSNMARKPLGVLILHGFTSSLDCVSGVEPPLKALGLPIRMPVLRGHGGESPEALRGITWRDWVADAEAALQDLLTEAERVIVFGHSMGGLVTLTLAAEHPDAVDSIVVAAAAIQLTSPLAPGRPLHILVPLVRPFLKKVDMPPVYADPKLARYDTNYPWAPADAALSLLTFSKITRRRLPEVRAPALIMQSRNDSTVAPESADIIYEGISTPPDQKRVVWFEETEHEMFRDCERGAAIATVVDYVRERAGHLEPGEAA